MLAAGGPGVGTTWTAIARREDEFLPDAHFVVATKARLAQLKVPAGATCRKLDNKGNAFGAAFCDAERALGSAAGRPRLHVQEGPRPPEATPCPARGLGAVIAAC